MRQGPTDWSEARLGQVCRVVSGGTPRTGDSRFWGGEVAWLTPSDMSRDRSQTVLSGERSLTVLGLESSSAQLFPAGSIIVSSRAPIGYVAIAGREMCTSQGCKTAVPPDFIDSRFLYWFLVSATPDLQARASGTTFQEISSRRFAETQLRWPIVAEQRQIVEILEDHLSRLDAAETYVAQVERRLAQLRRSALDLNFGGGNDQIALEHLVTRIEAGRSFGGSNRPAEPDEWGIIKVSAMTWGDFNPAENKSIPARLANPRFEIHEGDLLVSRANTNEYVGASVLVGPVRSRLLLSDKSLRLIPRAGVSPMWLWRTLQSPAVRQQISALATGTKDSMRNISQSALLSVRVPQVSELAQQDAVVRFDALADSLRSQGRAASLTRRRGSALRRAVLAAAFEGKLTGRHTDAEIIEEKADGER